MIQVRVNLMSGESLLPYLPRRLGMIMTAVFWRRIFDVSTVASTRKISLATNSEFCPTIVLALANHSRAHNDVDHEPTSGAYMRRANTHAAPQVLEQRLSAPIPRHLRSLHAPIHTLNVLAGWLLSQSFSSQLPVRRRELSCKMVHNMLCEQS